MMKEQEASAVANCASSPSLWLPNFHKALKPPGWQTSHQGATDPKQIFANKPQVAVPPLAGTHYTLLYLLFLMTHMSWSSVTQMSAALRGTQQAATRLKSD